MLSFRPNSVMALTFILVIVVTPVFAGQVADDFEPLVDPSADCIVGNLNGPALPPVENVFMGHEQYAYHIYPAEQCDCSEGGFSVEAIHQLLHFSPEQIPAEFVVRAALMTATQDGTTGCWVPDQALFVSPPINVIVIDNGIFEVMVPTPNSDIYPINAHYFLALYYEGMAEGQLAIDDQPMACTEYVNRGNGWEDLNLFAKSGGGRMIVWGDIVCGMPTVAGERSTFDAIKSLYR